MKLPVLLLSVLGLLLSSNTPAADGSQNVIAIQLCAITLQSKLTRLNVVFEGRLNSVSGVTFDTGGGSALTEEWTALSHTGQHVGSYWGAIDKDSTPTFVVVENYVLPLSMSEVPTAKWTAWTSPKFVVKDGYQFAIARANNQEPKLEQIRAADIGFRLRFKRMSFDAYLAHIQPHASPTKSWSDDPIPACL